MLRSQFNSVWLHKICEKSLEKCNQKNKRHLKHDFIPTGYCWNAILYYYLYWLIDFLQISLSLVNLCSLFIWCLLHRLRVASRHFWWHCVPLSIVQDCFISAFCIMCHKCWLSLWCWSASPFERPPKEQRTNSIPVCVFWSKLSADRPW